MRDDLRTKIVTEMLKSINQQAWPMIDDGVPAIDVCQRVAEIANDAIGFLKMTEERMREVFAESAARTVEDMVKADDREGLERYAKAVKRVAQDIDCKARLTLIREGKRRVQECPK